MKKYIDVELLKSKFTGIIPCEYPAPLVKAIIDNQPAADVKEVVHGKWIETGKTNSKAVCSECGRNAEYQTVNNVWEYENYCPHCGAKMD